MSNKWAFFPHAMTAPDLTAMREAVRLAEDIKGVIDEATRRRLAWLVFRYYSKGLTDPERLGAMAALLASSRVFACEPDLKVPGLGAQPVMQSVC
jgi:hypothetical protein